MPAQHNPRAGRGVRYPLSRSGRDGHSASLACFFFLFDLREALFPSLNIMVAALSDWSPAAVFAAALLSPGWGALLAGGFSWVFASSPELLGICAAAGGFLRDAGIYAILRRQNAETEKMPAGGFSLFSCIALQSIHLFRLDLARRAAADCVPSLRFFGALAAGSCLGALVGAFIAYFGLGAANPPIPYLPASLCLRFSLLKRGA